MNTTNVNWSVRTQKSQVPIVDGTKYCPRCEQWLPIASFYESGGACKACRCARSRYLYSHPGADRAKPNSEAVKFLSFAVIPDGCWEWDGAKDQDGYALFNSSIGCRASRFAYQLIHGAIPEDLQIDHKCRNRGCVNPLHLEAVELAVNVFRGEGRCSLNRRKTHCKRGHEFVEGSFYGRENKRQCKQCLLERGREYRKRKAQA